MANIRIQELTEPQIDELEIEPNFRSIQPVSCMDCGNKQDFKDQIFYITGFRNDESDSGIISFHMRESYGLNGYITRKFGLKTYLQAAVCPECGSTRIMFDLVMDFDNKFGRQGSTIRHR